VAHVGRSAGKRLAARAPRRERATGKNVVRREAVRCMVCASKNFKNPEPVDGDPASGGRNFRCISQKQFNEPHAI